MSQRLSSSGRDKSAGIRQQAVRTSAQTVNVVRQWWLWLTRPAVSDRQLISGLALAAEFLVIAFWAIIVTRPYLNMDPDMVPTGPEYLSAIQTHHLWTRASDCGWCALWDGSTRGGAPAFADIHGSMLHPLVLVTTLGWGVINGSKLALIGSFLLAGLIQWWMARLLGLGRLARVWSACLVVAAGHLSGKMELGAFGVVLSAVFCALALPLLLRLNRNPSCRNAVLLGVALALIILSGQGYMQIGLVLTLPVALLLLPREAPLRQLIWRRYLLAGALGLLLAAVFLVPFLHFLPNLIKDRDASFGSAQPFASVPLNLVINDPNFYRSEALNKLPYPHLYVNYIGWVPLLLAIYGALRYKRQEGRTIAFLALAAIVPLWISSGIPLRWLAKFETLPWLAEQAAGIRHPPQIASLAVPPMIALAAVGADSLLASGWRQFRLALHGAHNQGLSLMLRLHWLLIIPLLLSLASALNFSRNWIGTTRIGPEVYEFLESLKTPDLQWVNPPFGEHLWIEPAVRQGMKLHFGFRTWNWKDYHFPKPVLEANRAGPPPGMSLYSVVNDIPIYWASGREYAAVILADGSRVPCTAQGLGGMIDVYCEAPLPGTLKVVENSYSGWSATVDGQPAALLPGQWLSLEVPAGAHTVRLRYRPWDVPIGMALTLVGALLAGYLWFKPDHALRLHEPRGGD